MKTDRINYKLFEFLRTNINRIKRRKPNYKNFHTVVHNIVDSNKIISDAIISDKPFMIAKFGESELEVLRNYHAIKRSERKNKISLIFDFLKYGDKYEWTGLNTIAKDSGFFPEDENLLNKFSELYINCIEQVDFFATAHGLKGWYNNKGEDYVLKELNSHTTIISVGALDPFENLETFWTNNLKGKRVLVIHPFEKSIIENYKNREKHFPVTLLPEFELLTLPSVQSIAYTQTHYKDWFEALRDMELKIDKINFDIALIGCGAYGLPLAAYIKGMGKQAIHIGGVLQLYFGISGIRWDIHPIISKYYNEFWTRPNADEYPQKYQLVGGGNHPYW